MDSIKSSSRNQLIDVLRFALAFLTMFHHYEQAFNVSIISFSFISSGIYFLGVECFFVLSGYFELLKEDQLDKKFFMFFIKKAIRIYPMVIISTTVAYIVCYIYGTSGQGIINAQFSFINYLCNISLIFCNGIFGIEELGVNNPLWFLSVLLVIYMYIYFIRYICKKLKLNTNLLLFINIILFVCIETHEVSLPFFCGRVARGMIPFCVGGLLVSINNTFRNYQINVISFIGIIIIVFFYIIKVPFFIEYKRYIYIFALYPLIILFCINSKVVSKLFDDPFFNQLGKISFEMYVWHSPLYYVIVIINGHFGVLAVGEKWFACLIMFFIVGWSDLLYRFVEKPISKTLISYLPKQKIYKQRNR